MKYVKWSPKLNANNEEWDIKIETIFDMPKTGDTFAGLLHVELLSKDGSETLINENLNVIVERINTSIYLQYHTTTHNVEKFENKMFLY